MDNDEVVDDRFNVFVNKSCSNFCCANFNFCSSLTDAGVVVAVVDFLDGGVESMSIGSDCLLMVVDGAGECCDDDDDDDVACC